MLDNPKTVAEVSLKKGEASVSGSGNVSQEV